MGHCVFVSVPGTAWSGYAPGLSGGAKSSPRALPTPCGGVATCSIMLWSLPVFTYASQKNNLSARVSQKAINRDHDVIFSTGEFM